MKISENLERKLKMRAITRDMIKIYKIDKLGYDFMGYTFDKKDSLSFHHLIVPKKDCKKKGMGRGLEIWNGAVLNRDTSHDYLHIIEKIDRELFFAITSIMIRENINQEIDIDSLKEIREVLLYFEKEHINDTSKRGQKIIKPSYITDRIKL